MTEGRAGSASTGASARVGRWLCLAGAALGALGLVGAAVGSDLLTTVVPGEPPMMPNTALGLMLLGAAGALRGRRDAGRARKALSGLAAVVVLAIGLGTLIEYAVGIDLRIDQAFVHTTEVEPHPGRPAPPTALAFVLLSLALLLIDHRARARARPSEWLALAAGLTAFTALLGFAFRAELLYRLTRAPLIGVALPTAVSFLLTSVGLLLERPAAGVMRVATSPGPGGVQLRRLALPATLLPALLGLGVTYAARALRVEQLSLVLAVQASVVTTAGLFVLTVTAVFLNRTHEALEGSRARSRALVEEAPDGVFVADLDGRYTDVNDAGCRLLGYSRDEIIGKTIVDLIRPDEVDRLWQTKDKLLGGDTTVSEWTLRRKDGSYVPVEVSAKIFSDGRWQGLVRDVSERKRLETELRIAEAKSSGIVAVAADAIISIDEDQRITLFNEGAEKIFGYSRAEAIGAPLEMLIPERFRAAHRQHVAAFAAGAEGARRMGDRGTAIFGLRKSGQAFPADAAIARLEVGGTRILTVALRDVTAQKRVESEQRFLAEFGSALASTIDYDETVQVIAKLIVSALADASIVEAAAERGQVPHLVVAHRDPGKAAACRRLEQVKLDPARPHLGSAVRDTKQPLLIGEVTTSYLDSIAQSAEHRQALRELGPKSFMALPLVADGAVVGSLVLINTTADRHHGQDDIPFAEQVATAAGLAIEKARLYRVAQDAIRSRDDVLGIVAHDLRNPLGSILMQASLLRRRGVEPEAWTRKPSEAIQRAATRMNRLIQDLLDVARMEGARLPIDPARVSALQAIADAVQAQEPLATSASLELRLDVTPDLPDLWADRDRLLQVFENLIGNAVKFTEPGGRVTVGAAARDGSVLFWVADTGVGIAADDLPHVFERLWQARKAGRRGAGLGLPIVKGIVEAHGGQVWADSAEGRGSTFFFTMPVAAPADDWRSEPAPHAP